MYAVIFKAEVDQFDETYHSMAKAMRDLAIEKYRCKGFSACTEGMQEIAISYWESEQDIKAWKQNIEHLNAQQLGQKQWYKSYSVEICKVIREYSHSC